LVSISNVVSVKTSTLYEFSITAKGAIGKQFVLVFKSKDQLNQTTFLQPNGSWSTVYYDFYHTVSSEYQEFYSTFLSSASNSNLTIEIKRASASTSIYFDSLYIEEIPPTPTEIPSPTSNVAAPTQTPSPTPSPSPIVVNEPIIVVSPTATMNATPTIVLSPSPTTTITTQEEELVATPGATMPDSETDEVTASPSPSVSPTAPSQVKPTNKPLTLGNSSGTQPSVTPTATTFVDTNEPLTDTGNPVVASDNQKQNSFGNELADKTSPQKTLSYLVYAPIVVLSLVAIAYKKWLSSKKKFHPKPVHEYLSNESRNYLKDE
jgi:hypothetical protein